MQYPTNMVKLRIMSMREMLFLVAMFLLFNPINAYSRPLMSNSSLPRFGLHLEFGGHWFELVKSKTPYQYGFTMMHFSHGQPLAEVGKQPLILISDVHLGLAKFAEPKGPPWHRSFEMGFSLGFKQKLGLGQGKAGYLTLLTGPHFLSDSPLRQVAGFMFNTYLLGGTSFRLTNVLMLDVQFGWRHLSNAGMREPNGGINNVVVKCGLILYKPLR